MISPEKKKEQEKIFSFIFPSSFSPFSIKHISFDIMWKKRENHILDVYKNDEREALEEHKDIRLTNPHYPRNGNKIYQGSEFDVFGKDTAEEQFAPLYSKEQFTPRNKEKMDDTKRDILLRSEQKRGHLEAMLQHTTIIKKRKMSPIAAAATAAPLSNHVFIKSTAAFNTPIASIFVDSKQDHEDEDLAYY